MPFGKTHFEKRVTDEMGKIKDSLLTIPFNDPLLSKAQGMYKGLELALKFYVETNKMDLEDAA